MIDENGILYQSIMGGCLNYDPDKNRPTGIKSHDIKGLDIYKCLNCKPTVHGTELNRDCGSLEYCVNYLPKQKI